MSMFNNYIESKIKHNSRITQRPRPTKEDKVRLKSRGDKVQIIESDLISEMIIDELKLIHSSPSIKLIAIELTDYGVIQVRYKFIDVVEGKKDYGRECIYPFGNLKEN
ncbi:hypothetical protein [Mammaliicoccus lentus]|uniref:hypothetical protein n=1 Tax=Mammaliicoccus lentus TaxID=42858 RepID=UPI001071AD20|nr:hypothetical protein [Mammaliicoccus lentus]MBF0793348.1 hypothetical protein [Mammaliicoccus lentus]TFV17849.1 hypothetical protein E4T78_01695 [Mammaliicoccus lentus]